jgi:hypothetical protein
MAAFLVIATIVMIAKLLIKTKININAKKKRKNIDVMFVTVRNIENMLLKILIGSIVVVVLDLSST